MAYWTQPTDEQIEQVVPRLSDESQARYFFERLENPKWVAALSKANLFSHPPSQEELPNGMVRCRAWPPSRYLARMAEHVPEEVAGVLSTIDTNNWVIAGDIIDAMLVMPSPIIIRMIPVLDGIVVRLGMSYRLDDIASLVVQLVDEGYVKEGLDVVEICFVPNRKSAETSIGSGNDYVLFEELCKTIIPKFSALKPEEFCRIMTTWMLELVKAEKSQGIEDEDYSYIWRPAIEDHDQNQDFETPAKFVSCYRDSLDLAIREGGMAIDDALSMLNEQQLPLFSRFGLYIITEHAGSGSDLSVSAIMDRAAFDDYRLKHEYARLVGLHWSGLSETKRDDWLSWIEEGPPLYGDESESDPEEIAKRDDYWRFSRLHWIKDNLKGKWQELYDRAYAESGEPELSDLNVRTSGVSWGHESPYTVEQLEGKSFSEAVKSVIEWEHDGKRWRHDDPSIEGLAGVFQRYISTNPSEFSKQAHELKDTPANFVRKFLGAIEEALKKGTPVDVPAVLELCAWVVSQQVDEETAKRDDSTLPEPGWQWCRDAVSETVRVMMNPGAEGGEAQATLEMRVQLWSVIEPLVYVPAKEYMVPKDGEDSRSVDWPMRMLNSARGKAMLTVFAYAEWIATCEDGDLKAASFHGSFDAMPEVREFLDRLIKRPDPDFTERASFGYRLGMIRWLDQTWMEENAGELFDLAAYERDPATAFGWAAWNSFLYANHPHSVFYELLKEQFSQAVDQASERLPEGGTGGRPQERMGEHLVILYGRGDLGEDPETALDVNDRIIRRLVTETHIEVRSHAMQFVGNTLGRGDAGDIPTIVLDRFQRLWDFYWESIGRDDATANPRSAVFGYWFDSGIFDDQWAIEQMEAFTEVAPKADPDHMIMERLVEICEVDLARAAKITRSMVIGDDEGWRLHSWKDQAREILSKSMAAGGEARTIAEEAIDVLGRRGHIEFGELLEIPSGA